MEIGRAKQAETLKQNENPVLSQIDKTENVPVRTRTEIAKAANTSTGKDLSVLSQNDTTDPQNRGCHGMTNPIPSQSTPAEVGAKKKANPFDALMDD